MSSIPSLSDDSNAVDSEFDATALSWRYPCGRPLFIVFAILVGLERLDCKLHFLSGVQIGAAIGLKVAHTCRPPVGLVRFSIKLECGWHPRDAD